VTTATERRSRFDRPREQIADRGDAPNTREARALQVHQEVGRSRAERDLALRVLVLPAVPKIVATSVCYASGNAGGIFGPSMFIGAMIGGAVGQGRARHLPGDDRWAGCVCASRHGNRIRLNHPHPDHVGHHDFRSDAEL
jgi:hypothetical protein